MVCAQVNIYSHIYSITYYVRADMILHEKVLVQIQDDNK